MSNPARTGAFELAASVVAQLDAEGARADRALRRALRQAPHLDDAGRALAARLVHGTRCWEALLEVVLAPLERTPTPAERVAAYAIVRGEVPADEVHAALLAAAEAIEAALDEARWERALDEGDAVTRVARRASWPEWAARRLVEERGEEAALALALSLNVPGPLTLRVNLQRTTRSAVLMAMADRGHDAAPGPAPESIVVRTRLNVRGDPAWQRGDYEVQDAGSQLIATSVGAGPGDVVVDLCAGRGGKTLALAGANTVVASDVDGEALESLRVRAARAGMEGLVVARVSERLGEVERRHDLPPPLDAWAGKADRVLVDAPCSAFGTLRRGPDHRWRLSEAEAQAFPARQEALLRRGAELVRPGGRLVYATCTLFRSENDDVVDAFLAERPRFTPAEVFDGAALPLEGTGGARVELSPLRHGTDGFFLTALTRRGG